MKTDHLDLPFLMPEQAQKHVTVNSALQRLDLLVQMRLKALGTNDPPGTSAAGDGYGLGDSPTGAWSEHAGQCAFMQDGAWVFVTPQNGWRSWSEADGKIYLYGINGWEVLDTQSSPASPAIPAGMQFTRSDHEHVITAGAQNVTGLVIPAHTTVLAITGIVQETITGQKTWQLGVAEDTGRYGNQIGYQQGSTVKGLSAYPQVYYAPTPVVVKPVSGLFVAGKIHLRLYSLTFSLPRL